MTKIIYLLLVSKKKPPSKQNNKELLALAHKQISTLNFALFKIYLMHSKDMWSQAVLNNLCNKKLPMFVLMDTCSIICRVKSSTADCISFFSFGKASTPSSSSGVSSTFFLPPFTTRKILIVNYFNRNFYEKQKQPVKMPRRLESYRTNSYQKKVGSSHIGLKRIFLKGYCK